jgi:tetratricopeptide (TPR) repeat protein
MAEINLGIISGIFADYQKSKDYFNKALKYFEKTGEKMRIAEIYNNLGLMNYNAGNLGISLDEYNRSIKICLEINYFQLLGISFLGKATTYLKLGNLQLAAALSDKAMTICNKSGDRLTVADIYKVKGIIERESSRYNESENLLKTSLMINRELGNKLNEAETSVKLGRWFILLNEKKKSKEMFRNALAYYVHTYINFLYFLRISNAGWDAYLYLDSKFNYDSKYRTHLGINKDTPEGRLVQ